jgi:hypothetical protein
LTYKEGHSINRYELHSSDYLSQRRESLGGSS